MIRFYLALVALVFAALACASSARAHATPTSSIVLDVRPGAVDAELELPIDQLELALGVPIGERGALFPAEEATLRAYLALHVQLASSAGAEPWASEVGALTVHPREGVPTVRAAMMFEAPAGADLRELTVTDDAILHRVVTHRIFVSTRRDFEHARFEDAPKVVGVCLFTRTSVVIHREGGSLLRGFGAMVRLGARHIAEGTDHLLFLFLLLVTAPLVASGDRGRLRWEETKTARATLRSILAVVTAFTLGHSLSLVAGALGLLRVPSRPIEALIAVSILVTSIHALRPIVAKRETWIAAGFGLVHGLAFAETLASFGLHGGALGLSLLGFNLGIEAMQLVVVAAVVPSLLVLRAHLSYGVFRIASAAFAFVAACGWLSERVSGHDNAVRPGLALLAPHAWLAIVALAVAAVARAKSSGFFMRDPVATGSEENATSS